MKYVGGGVNANTNALATFMGQNVLSNAPFAVIWQNGKLTQLNQNGESGVALATAVQAIDDTALNRVYKKTDFR